MICKPSVVGDTLYDLRYTIALQRAGWWIYDESWASFRGGNWRCDFRLGGGGNFGGSRNSSPPGRAEHAAGRQERRPSGPLARGAAQKGIQTKSPPHEEDTCVVHSLYLAIT